MVQKRETKAINKLCVREILRLSFVCGAYFFEFRGRNLICFVIAYNFNGKYAPEAGKTRMRTTFFTRAPPGYVLGRSGLTPDKFMHVPFKESGGASPTSKSTTNHLLIIYWPMPDIYIA